MNEEGHQWVTVDNLNGEEFDLNGYLSQLACGLKPPRPLPSIQVFDASMELLSCLCIPANYLTLRKLVPIEEVSAILMDLHVGEMTKTHYMRLAVRLYMDVQEHSVQWRWPREAEGSAGATAAAARSRTLLPHLLTLLADFVSQMQAHGGKKLPSDAWWLFGTVMLNAVRHGLANWDRSAVFLCNGLSFFSELSLPAQRNTLQYFSASEFHAGHRFAYAKYGCSD
eukprot:SAG11_NODE_34_length_22265_cov_11.264730_19_plen_225_part_00